MQSQFAHTSGDAGTGFFDRVLPSMKNLSTTLRLSALACACATCISGYAQTIPLLKEVVITANRLEQALQTAPIGVSVILGVDIRASGVLDANEAVRKLGGVSARSDLNGGREYSLELASARLSAISPDQIERIEIVRGGSSVMWGEGASGGVIAVTTKKGAVKPGLTGSVQQGFESYGGHDTRLGLQMAASSNVVFTAGLRQYANDGYRQNSAQKQELANFGVQVGEGGFKARVGSNWLKFKLTRASPMNHSTTAVWPKTASLRALNTPQKTACYSR
jgi:iron complex outermembrane recepter protein